VLRSSFFHAFVFAAPAALCGCGSSQPIVIHPAFPQVARSACPAPRARFVVESAVDDRGYMDPRNVGFTQTGLANDKTRLLTELPAADVVKAALENALSQCGVLGPGGATPAVRLRVRLLAFQVTEETSFVNETMRGELRYEIQAMGADGTAPLGRFAVGGEAHVSAADTTDYAASIVSRAIAESLPGLLAQLASVEPATP
jgi:hypothetical protein